MSGQDRLESIRPAVAGLAGTSTVQDNSGDEQSAHVKLDDVGHSFDGDDWLFRHITMTLYPRRVYALVGPSGSGKSIQRMKLYKPDEICYLADKRDRKSVV